MSDEVLLMEAFNNETNKYKIEHASLLTQIKIVYYLNYTNQIRDALPAGAALTQWIDGSFVTGKQNPNDIDLVTFVDFALYEQYEPFFDGLRQLRYERKTSVDGYFVKTYPVSHPDYSLYDLDRADWYFRFLTPKPKGNKGFVTLTF